MEDKAAFIYFKNDQVFLVPVNVGLEVIWKTTLYSDKEILNTR